MKRRSFQLVRIEMPEAQIAMVRDEVETTLIGLSMDLAHLKDKSNPGKFVSEVAAYGRLASYLHSGTARLPDRFARKALRRLARELDDRNEYEQVVAEHDAFAAFEKVLRSAAGQGRA